MNSLIDRLKLVFLGLFALSVVAALAYQLLVKGPEHRCENAGNWWDAETRVCAIPMPLSAITGRQPGGPRLSQDPALPTDR